MTRQRLGLFLVTAGMTATLASGSAVPTLAQGLAPAGSPAGKPMGTTAPIHRPGPEPGLFTLASEQALSGPQCTRWCNYPIVLGIAY